MPSIKERLLKYIDYKGVSKSKFYQSIGLANGFLDKAGSIGADKVEKICYQYPDLNIMWLITGVGDMITHGITAVKVTSDDKSKKIPLVKESVIAGFGGNEFSIAEQDVKEYYVVPKFKFVNIDFMIEIYGSSMYPKYHSGDIIACTTIKDRTFLQWNKCHVIATREQGILVKRLKKGDTENSILAVSDNKDYDPFLIPMEEITGIALVVGLIRLV